MLVSIQSLILVDEPYYCEPGYEGQMHTEHGNRASKAYTLSIRSASCNQALIMIALSGAQCWDL